MDFLRTGLREIFLFHLMLMQLRTARKASRDGPIRAY
jgi:hypothetical protein